MTRPINLYLQSRITEEAPFNRVERHASGKTDLPRTRAHEIASLASLVDALLRAGVAVDALDGFFYGYHIPHIGKEFDLLKLSAGETLNIELKSRAVPKKQMLDQLLRNRHYLAHLGTKNFFFTVVMQPLSCYALGDDGTLRASDFDELAAAVTRFSSGYLEEIDTRFRASDFLVSPVGTPEKFVRGEYFLTPAQEYIEKRIRTAASARGEGGFFSLSGRPGTGKTLLLYDLAKGFSHVGETLVVHCGALSEGQRTLCRALPCFSVVAEEAVTEEVLTAHRFVLVDESHRLSPERFSMLVRAVTEARAVCVFSYDPEQILTTAERENAIADRIAALPLVGRYELSEKLRTNRELWSFISAVRGRPEPSEAPQRYENVSLSYAASTEEARRVIAYFRERGYVFIRCAPAVDDSYGDFMESVDAEWVVGQEFDRVLMLLDGSFYYDDAGMLCGIPTPDPDHIRPNLFYRGITRVREKLALVVVNAPALFERISRIVE